MEFHASEDVKVLMSDFTNQENRLRIKRRWLAGLPLTKKDEKVIFGSESKPNRTGCEGPHDHTATEDVCGQWTSIGFML